MYKLIRTAAAKRTALNLENDTDKIETQTKTVIPNELNLAGKPVRYNRIK